VAGVDCMEEFVRDFSTCMWDVVGIVVYVHGLQWEQ
jgi:hypothetical protein